MKRNTISRMCSRLTILLFALVLLGRAGQAAAPTTLVSVNTAGTDSGNGSSLPDDISANGRFVVFESDASNLVATDTNGAADVFVRDLRLGTTTLVSANAAATDTGNGESRSRVRGLSANGRFVVFDSDASNLAATDTNGTRDIFLRDLKLGTTTLVSVNLALTDSGNGTSGEEAISENGRFVIFTSDASNLGVVNDTNGTSDVFVYDRKLGASAIVSVNTAVTDTGNDSSELGDISANGRFVLFNSVASDLVPSDTNGTKDVFVRDRKLRTTTLVTVNTAGTDTGNGQSFGPAISRKGRFVTFESGASNLVATDTNGAFDVFVRDLKHGTTTLASVNMAGTDSGNGSSLTESVRSISANGRFVVFSSDASNLGATDTNGTQDVFVRDLKLGTTILVSANSAGTDSGNGLSVGGEISANGRFVVFDSHASNLVATDTNGATDTFVRDLKLGTTILVSVNAAGTDSGNGVSSGSIRGKGRFALFYSDASNLVATDTNGTTDVFVRALF